MKKRTIIWSTVLGFLLLATIASAWWTPYDSPLLRCTYELMNVTNVTVCDNGTLLFTAGGYIITNYNGNLNLNPGGIGIIYTWANINVTYHNITNVNYINPEGTNLNIGGNVNIVGGLNISGTINISGNLNMSKHNITNVDYIFVDNLTGDPILVHTDFLMDQHNITNLNWLKTNYVNATLNISAHAGYNMYNNNTAFSIYDNYGILRYQMYWNGTELIEKLI
jgi:hypothetical protein